MKEEERPLERSDYSRAYAVMTAMHLKVAYEEERPMWEILRDLHMESLDYGLEMDEADAIVGAEPADREVRHAMIVLEMLMRGKSTIQKAAASQSVYTVCSTPGCSNPTVEQLCMHCELGLSGT